MNGKKWPVIRLNEVLALHLDKVETTPATEFKIAGVYSFGRGLFQREPLSGSDTTYKYFNRLHEDDYVISQPKAWEGAIARVPAELDGWFLSPVFPTFRANPDRLDIRYLEWFGKQSVVWDRLRNVSQGMGARRDSVHPDKFLSIEIPLPPLEEQQRIVARIDRLASMIDESQQLRRKSSEECDQLCRAILRDDRFGAPTPTQMHELVTWRKPDIEVVPTESYEFAGVYCFGRGVFRGQRKTGTEFAYKQLTQIRAGEFIYPKLMAWEGALAVVPEECDGLYVSPEFPLFVIDEDKVLPEVLDVYFRSPAVWPLLSGASTGTNVRRKRLNPSDFLKYVFPLPTRETQFALRSIRRKVTDLQSHSNQSAQLKAILPSILDRAFKGEL